MTDNRLIVVAGIPGTRIRRSLEKFALASESDFGQKTHVISLDAKLTELAKPVLELIDPNARGSSIIPTLMLPLQSLRVLWAEALDAVMAEVTESLEDSHVIVTLHLAYYHQLTKQYLSPTDLGRLSKELVSRSNAVVTLIDDIYDCHRALMQQGTGWSLVPGDVDSTVLELLQLLDWRSVEILLADAIAYSSGVRHHIFAVKHPLKTFSDLLFSDKPVLYFSHPIAEPRRSLATGDEDAARGFVREMADVVTRLQGPATVIEPTSIDELRFEGATGNLTPRWPFSVDERSLLYVPPGDAPPRAASAAFPVGWDLDDRGLEEGWNLLDELQKVISTQVGARDHSLVEQAERLVCYRPVFKGNASGGVQEEIEHVDRLITLGHRSIPSLVLALSDDLERFRPRRLAEHSIPEWKALGHLEGDDVAFEQLASDLLAGEVESERIDKIVAGDWEELIGLFTERNIHIVVRSGGPLDHGIAALKQKLARELVESVQADALYLEALEKRGTVEIVKSEQLFYTNLNVT